jgi:hypothetical protein
MVKAATKLARPPQGWPRLDDMLAGMTVRTKALTAREEAALDLLLDVIGEHGKPGPDGEPAVPLEAWRTKVRTMFPDHANPRQMVRRTMRTLIACGCVLERDGLVAVGNFMIEIEVAG